MNDKYIVNQEAHKLTIIKTDGVRVEKKKTYNFYSAVRAEETAINIIKGKAIGRTYEECVRYLEKVSGIMCP